MSHRVILWSLTLKVNRGAFATAQECPLNFLHNASEKVRAAVAGDSGRQAVSLRGEIVGVTTELKSARRPRGPLFSRSLATRNIIWLGCLASLEIVCLADSPTLNSTSYPYVGVTLSHYSASKETTQLAFTDQEARNQDKAEEEVTREITTSI